ncbi:MAG: 30S ribosomal protein S2, partial [Candidatus Magasanikbacteria bacterium CG10_big_fil_rev_8_21_14_0_10_38_6]
TKPQARDIVKAAALSCGAPYLVDRWIGGLLTNFQEIKKLIQNYNKLKEQQANGELEKYTKKEQLAIAKQLEKMDQNLAGLAGLKKMPEALFIPSMQREKTAVIEANRTGVEIIAVCDTNANPDKADYIIPANDDAVKAIRLITDLIAAAVNEGKTEYESKQAVGQKKA